jgi:NAD(P)-dependent dehydrogenase (short-subunit alcohol dehydrogenase family)
VLFNAGTRVKGPLEELDANEVARVLQINAFGGFLVAQQAVRRMLKHGAGKLFFTGATASVKGFAQSSPFAMSKFALRGLAQSLARELGPRGIHVAHFIVDGAVQAQGSAGDFTAENIARSYMAILDQPPGAWTWEIELRRQIEPF